MKKTVIVSLGLTIIASFSFVGVQLIGSDASLGPRPPYSSASIREQGRNPGLREFSELIRSSSTDVIYDPYDELLEDATGALLGLVTSVTSQFNLQPSQDYEVHGDYDMPLIFSEARVTVLQWYRNKGGFPEDVLTIVSNGGIVPTSYSSEEAQALEAEQPGVVQSGDSGWTGYSSGDAAFVQGQMVALLINSANFAFYSGTESVPMVTGGEAGKFVVEGDELHSAVASIRQDPRAPIKLTDFIEDVRRTGP
jgi:hypothetical protein